MENIRSSQPSEVGMPPNTALAPDIIEAARIVANTASTLAPYSAESTVAALVSPLIAHPAPLFVVSTPIPTRYAEKDDEDALSIIKVISAFHGNACLKPHPRVRYSYAVDDIEYSACMGDRMICFAGINTPTRYRSLSRAVRKLYNAKGVPVFCTGFDGYGPENFDEHTVWIRTEGCADAETIEEFINSPDDISAALRTLTTGDHMNELIEPEYMMWNVPEPLRPWQRSVDVALSLTRPFMPDWRNGSEAIAA